MSCFKKQLLKSLGRLLNDGAKRNRLLYLKIMYTEVRKILYLQGILRQLHFWEEVPFFSDATQAYICKKF